MRHDSSVTSSALSYIKFDTKNILSESRKVNFLRIKQSILYLPTFFLTSLAVGYYVADALLVKYASPYAAVRIKEGRHGPAWSQWRRPPNRYCQLILWLLNRRVAKTCFKNPLKHTLFNLNTVHSLKRDKIFSYLYS